VPIQRSVPNGSSPAVQRLVWALVALFVAFVLSSLLKGVYDYFTEWYFSDRYWVLETAQQVAEVGINRVRFLPNSSYGIDILLWTHFLPSYLYALGVALLDIRIYDLTLIRVGELLVTLGAVIAVFARYLPLRWALALTAVTFLEPIFHLTFIHGEFMRWTLVFGLVSFLCLGPPGERRGAWAQRGLDFLAGASAVLAPLCFVSLGLPILLGLSIAFLVEVFAARGAGGRVARIAAFGLGAALPLLGVAVHLLAVVGIEELKDLWACMTQYAPQVSTVAGQRKGLLRVGYFLASLLVAPWGVTLLPVGIAATALNLLHLRQLGSSERFLTRTAAIFTGTWIACALIVPAHFTSARMMWLLPFHLLQILIALRSRQTHPVDFLYFAAASALALIVGGAYHALGRPGGIYSFYYAIPVALALLLAGAAVGALRTREHLRRCFAHWIDRHGLLGLAGLLVLVLGQMVFAYGKLWWEAFPPLVRGEYREPIVRTLAREIRKVAERELAPGDWVLSNASVREFFPEGVQRQEMFLFRRTKGDAGIGGARWSPADKAFLLFPDAPPPYPTELEHYGTELGPGRSFYYGGFVYALGPRIEIVPGFVLLVGTPIAADEAKDVVYPHPRNLIPKEETEAYLRWREAAGVPVR
jgi:hypothetical protein